MIRTFSSKDSLRIWEGHYSPKIPTEIQNRAMRKLRQLDAAQNISDLRNPPGNHLEKLHGDRSGQMSIRINQRWRICFVWKDPDAFDVEIIDYHK